MTFKEDDSDLPRRDWVPPPSDEYQKQNPDWNKTKTDHADDNTLPHVWLKDLQIVLDTPDLIQGVLLERSSIVVYGESNAGKTFWVTDLSLHIAAGMTWNGRRVEQSAVVYCCLEGSAHFRNRLVAWRDEHGLGGQEVPFAAVEVPIDLLHPDADTSYLISLIQATARKIKMPVKLVVIDTLSRALAGGNENGPEDMGALVKNMDRIRAETGVAVLFVHHSGKDAAKGARGHTILRAAIDTEIQVVDAGGMRTATVLKQRDLEKGDTFGFRLKVIELGHNRYGEPVTTCIVEPAGDQNQAQPKKEIRRLPKKAQIAADMLNRCLSKWGQSLPAAQDYPTGVTAVKAAQWRDEFMAGFPDERPDSKRAAFRRARDTLIAEHIVTSFKEFVWFTRASDERRDI